MSDYRALYRKWRPADFDEVYGQNGITDILKYEVSSNRLSHAYLLCGSRGTGKTSCAKILAKAVNCLNSKDGNPCNECQACKSIEAGIATDVIEMDAASNNGVDNVRDMIDEIAYTPAELKYRVYIIDEVHMMSASAFNALLKTLEEPPTYVIFILATTEFHKLPTTIVSRCQRFDFKRIDSESIISRLKHVSEKENISITDDGARVIARISRGGMRDALSLLELCAGVGKTIDAQAVFDTVGSGNRESTYQLIKAILAKDYSLIYETVNDVVMKSGDLSVFWQELIDSYRDLMVVKNTDRAKEYLDLTELEYEELKRLSGQFTPAMLAYHVSILEQTIGDMLRSFNSKRAIAEIALTRMCDARSLISMESLALRIEEMEREMELVKLGATSPSANSEVRVEVLPAKKEKDAKADSSASDSGRSTENKGISVYTRWEQVLLRIEQIKCPLSVKFKNSKAYIKADGSFVIKMSAFFATQLTSNESDMKILRGVIAEAEKKDVSDVKLVIEPYEGPSASDALSELADAIDK